MQELSGSNEENPDLIDIELIQHINLDVTRLTKILSGQFNFISIYTNWNIWCFVKNCYISTFIFSETNQKFKSLKKNVYVVLMNSLEKVIWNFNPVV